MYKKNKNKIDKLRQWTKDSIEEFEKSTEWPVFGF